MNFISVQKKIIIKKVTECRWDTKCDNEKLRFVEKTLND